MNLDRLASKQLRLSEWRRFVDEQVQSDDLRERTGLVLDKYQQLLTQVWKAGSVSTDDAREIDTLERNLERLNEEARMTVIPRNR